MIILAALSTASCGDTSGAGPTASGATGSTSTTAAATGVGVPACDAYLARMRACIAAAPSAERAERERAVNETEKTWRAVQDEKDRALLVTPCKKMIAQLDQDGVCK